MNATVKRIVELLFQDVEMTEEVKALEEEILNNCQDRYEDQIAQGRSEDDAIAAVVDSLKGMEDVLAEYRKRSPEQETVQEAKSILDGVLEQLSDMAKAFGKLGSQFATAMMGDEDNEHVDEDEDDDEEHADEDDEDDAHGSETITIKLGGRKYNGEDADEDERVLTFDPAQIETLQFNLLDETVEVTEGAADTVVVRYDKDTSVEVSQKEGVLLFEHKSSAKRQNKSAGLSAKLLQLIGTDGQALDVERIGLAVEHQRLGRRFFTEQHLGGRGGGFRGQRLARTPGKQGKQQSSQKQQQSSFHCETSFLFFLLGYQMSANMSSFFANAAYLFMLFGKIFSFPSAGRAWSG